MFRWHVRTIDKCATNQKAEWKCATNKNALRSQNCSLARPVRILLTYLNLADGSFWINLIHVNSLINLEACVLSIGQIDWKKNHNFTKSTLLISPRYHQYIIAIQLGKNALLVNFVKNIFINNQLIKTYHNCSSRKKDLLSC